MRQHLCAGIQRVQCVIGTTVGVVKIVIGTTFGQVAKIQVSKIRKMDVIVIVIVNKVFRNDDRYNFFASALRVELRQCVLKRFAICGTK